MALWPGKVLGGQGTTKLLVLVRGLCLRLLKCHLLLSVVAEGCRCLLLGLVRVVLLLLLVLLLVLLVVLLLLLLLLLQGPGPQPAIGAASRPHGLPATAIHGPSAAIALSARLPAPPASSKPSGLRSAGVPNIPSGPLGGPQAGVRPNHNGGPQGHQRHG